MTNEYLELEEKVGLEIGVFPNKEKWDVVLDQTIMATFADRETAIETSKSIYIAYETGYLNGILLAQKNPQVAIEALVSRGFNL